MDDELCDTVVLGAAQLRATFNAVAAGLIHQGFGANATTGAITHLVRGLLLVILRLCYKGRFDCRILPAHHKPIAELIDRLNR
jgi:hypothetical protein